MNDDLDGPSLFPVGVHYAAQGVPSIVRNDENRKRVCSACKRFIDLLLRVISNHCIPLVSLCSPLVAWAKLIARAGPGHRLAKCGAQHAEPASI
jgi:hypothetical protein